MYEVDCAHEDDFMVKTEDENEAIDMIQQHARQKHDTDLGEDDARDMLQQT